MKLRICVASLLFLVQGVAFAQSCSKVGTAYLNHIINWSQTSDLQFTVSGGQPNVCGHFTSIRDGAPYDYGWVACTDASGNAIMGPYTWASRTADQSDTNLLITWPNCNYTMFETNHYWDITLPTPAITSGHSLRAAPINFSGTGNDGIGGAGFSSSWTAVKVKFQDTSTGYYWDPVARDYTAASAPDINAPITSVLGSIGPGTNDSPIYQITWDAHSVIPPVSIHQLGDSYTWTVTIEDGDSRTPKPTDSISFTVQCTPHDPC